MYSMFMGMLFCILQAFAQVLHPTQRSRLMAMPSLVMIAHLRFLDFDEGIGERDDRAAHELGASLDVAVVRDFWTVAFDAGSQPSALEPMRAPAGPDGLVGLHAAP